MAHRIVVVLLALGTLTAAAPAAAHEDQAPPRTVAVSGAGEIKVKPDRARLTLYADRLAPEVKAGEAEVNRVVRAYLAEAKALGAKEEHVATTGVSIQPEYVWDEKARQQRLAGYRVRREIAVQVDNLDKLGDFIMAATKAGVNQVNPPQLESSEPKALDQRALVKAAEDARARAQLLAETLGARLGPVRTISAADSGRPPPMPMYQMKARAEAAMDGNAEMGVSLGEITHRAEVSAEFDLMPQ